MSESISLAVLPSLYIDVQDQVDQPVDNPDVDIEPLGASVVIRPSQQPEPTPPTVVSFNLRPFADGLYYQQDADQGQVDMADYRIDITESVIDVDLQPQPGSPSIPAPIDISISSGLPGQSAQREARHAWSAPYSYIGIAAEGSDEDAPVWRITRINGNTAETAEAMPVAWSDRLTAVYA